MAHIISLGREFHNAAVDVSISLFSLFLYLIVLLRFGTNDVVDEERSGLAGEYQWNKSIMYCGASRCKTLNGNTTNFSRHLCAIGSRININGISLNLTEKLCFRNIHL